MSEALERYQAILTRLRERRRQPEHIAEEDRGDLADLEDLYAQLTPAERDLVEDESWRAWPDEYDNRMGR